VIEGVAPVAPRVDVEFTQGAPGRPLHTRLFWRRRGVEVDRVGVDTRRHLGDSAFGATLPDDEVRAPVTERLAEVGDRLTAKPGAVDAGLLVPERPRPAVLGLAVLPGVEDVHRNETVGRRRLGQRLVVVKPEIVAKPDDCGVVARPRRVGCGAGGVGAIGHSTVPRARRT